MSFTIRRAKLTDHRLIARIGRAGVEEAHRESCSAADMQSFLATHYTDAAIRADLADGSNIYHVIAADGRPAGFSKVRLNEGHPNIPGGATSKLDRIYLLREFYDMKLGFELLSHNIQLSKQYGQSGMWLFTWVGNQRAVAFYKKAGFRIIGDHKFKVSETHYNEHYQMLLTYSRL